MGWAFRKKRDMPSGLWMKCRACGKMVYRKQVEERLNVCPECGHHEKIPGWDRVAITLDEGSFEPFAEEYRPSDVLGFTDRDPYGEKLATAQEKTGLSEAALVGIGSLKGMRVVMGVLDFSFFGGSMGQVVGERITAAAERAAEEQVPLLVFSASGGARMQEGAVSLMQMAKTSAAIRRLKASPRTPYISVLTNPTTGGVTASFAALGDIIVAEPKALIGFAGPRVIQTTLRTDLPDGFQTAEFLLKKGFLDRIVPREQLRDELSRLLEYCLD
ncbi:MAG: acetyl-CoA carboxylase carboxyltransferase subunit beta [Candidatus Latescibacteria bacterium]|nr:acetyl-CoA carboxylase carboxyltransferase subunit beta [Candidatus Latescibacterota bacterium]